MERRSTTWRSPQELIEAVQYEPMSWPWKTVRMERDSLTDYSQRPGSANVSVAELYHENSKLAPFHRHELAAARTDPDALRRDVSQRRFLAAEADADMPRLPLAPALSRLLAATAAAAGPELFYAIELRVIVPDGLGLFDPGQGITWLIAPVSSGDFDTIARALRVIEPDRWLFGSRSYLALIGRFARNDLLYGARGYRRTLMDGGRLLQEIIRQGALIGLAVSPHLEFADHPLDDLLQVDGTEAGTIAVLELGGMTDVRES